MERTKNCLNVLDCDQTRKEVAVKAGADKNKKYTFDMVFGPAAKQIEVYRSVICPILDEVIMGYNCTVFAYGQTGTGKTFTMEGERSGEEFSWEDDPLAGIIPRTLHQIFEKLTVNGSEFSVKVSLLEIYNEELFDLLNTSTDITERLQLFDDSSRNKRGVTIRGLEEIVVKNKNEVYAILERGAAKRRTAATLMNAYSSRSHSVFSITIHLKETTLEGEELIKIGKLNLVDLAGSENIGRSGAVDKRAREAGNINQSLLTLGRVITALVEKRPHIPYRESKLTRILADSLGGGTKTSIIATISPASMNYEETVSTLEYANRAKSILNKPEVNQKLTKSCLIREYTEEIERLKRDLAVTREKNGVYVSADNYENMTAQISCQGEQIDEYVERIAAMEEELKKVVELFEDSKSQLEQRNQELEEKGQVLQETLGNLEETKSKLSQEEFVSTHLTTTQEKLYSTAGQLLVTAESSTSDVSGLHAKLDRKKSVEEYNSEIQMNFSLSMENMFSQMQRSVEQQSSNQQGMFERYTTSIDELLTLNRQVLQSSVAAVASSLTGVKQLVAGSVAKLQAKMAQQEGLCAQTQESLQQCLVEHKEELEKVLVAQVLPGLSSILEMNEAQKRNAEIQRGKTTQMELLIQQMGVFLSGHAENLAVAEKALLEGLEALEAERLALREKIFQAEQKKITGTCELIQRMAELLVKETSSGIKSLSEETTSEVITAADRLTTSIGEINNNATSLGVYRGQTVEQQDQFAPATSLVRDLEQTTQESQSTAQESSGYCCHLQSSLEGLSQNSLQWCSNTSQLAQNQSQQQLSMVRDNMAATQSLSENMESSCERQLQEARVQFEQNQEQGAGSLGAMKDQIGNDRITFEGHRRELQAHSESGLARVLSFVSEELRRDIPTGTTPQRKEYSYPRVLDRTRSRAELLETYQQQQGAPQVVLNLGNSIMEEEEEVDSENPQTDQDSVEDQATDSTGGEEQHSFVDENLTCNERGPFFKEKRSHKKSRKEKTPHDATPTRSRLPLRSKN